MFPLPLAVTVAPSRRLRAGLALLHLAALAALWLAELPLAVQIAGSVLLAISPGVHGGQAEALTLRGTRKGALEVRRNNRWMPAAAFSVKLLTPFLVLLHIELPAPARSRYLIVLPDSLRREDFRRLRVWIRWLAQRPRKSGDGAGIAGSLPG